MKLARSFFIFALALLPATAAGQQAPRPLTEAIANMIKEAKQDSSRWMRKRPERVPELQTITIFRASFQPPALVVIPDPTNPQAIPRSDQHYFTTINFQLLWRKFDRWR